MLKWKDPSNTVLTPVYAYFFTKETKVFKLQNHETFSKNNKIEIN